MSDVWLQMPLSALAFALQLASSEEDREPKAAAKPWPKVVEPQMPDLDELTLEFTREHIVTHPSLAA